MYDKVIAKIKSRIQKSRAFWRTRSFRISIFVFTLVASVGIFLVPHSVQAQSMLTSMGNGILEAIASLMFVIARVFISLAVFSLKFFIELAQYNNYIEAPPVVLGWIMVRDIANMFFVVALLVIAFSTILGLESYEWQKSFVKLVIAAIFINFSKMILQLLIDASQIFTLTFLNAVSATAAGNLINMFKLDQVMKMLGDQTKSGGDLRLDFIAAGVMAMVMGGMTMVLMGAYTLIMLARLVVLWACMILSPLAFVAMVLPQTKSYADEFWQEFTHHVLAAPVMVFFLWLAFATLGNGNIVGDLGLMKGSGDAAGNVGEQLGLSTANSSVSLSSATTWENLGSFLIAMAFLYLGIQKVEKLGVKGGSFVSGAVDFGKKVAMIGGGIALAKWTLDKGKEGAKLAGKGVGLGLYHATGAASKVEIAGNYFKREWEGYKSWRALPPGTVKEAMYVKHKDWAGASDEKREKLRAKGLADENGNLLMGGTLNADGSRTGGEKQAILNKDGTQRMGFKKSFQKQYQKTDGNGRELTQDDIEAGAAKIDADGYLLDHEDKKMAVLEELTREQKEDGMEIDKEGFITKNGEKIMQLTKQQKAAGMTLKDGKVYDSKDKLLEGEKAEAMKAKQKEEYGIEFDKNFEKDKRGGIQKWLGGRYAKRIESRKKLEKTTNQAKNREELLDKRTTGNPSYILQRFESGEGGLLGKRVSVDAEDRVEQGQLEAEKMRSAAKTKEFQSLGKAVVLKNPRYKDLGWDSEKGTLAAQLAQHEGEAMRNEAGIKLTMEKAKEDYFDKNKRIFDDINAMEVGAEAAAAFVKGTKEANVELKWKKAKEELERVKAIKDTKEHPHAQHHALQSLINNNPFAKAIFEEDQAHAISEEAKKAKSDASVVLDQIEAEPAEKQAKNEADLEELRAKKEILDKDLGQYTRTEKPVSIPGVDSPEWEEWNKANSKILELKSAGLDDTQIKLALVGSNVKIDADAAKILGGTLAEPAKIENPEWQEWEDARGVADGYKEDVKRMRRSGKSEAEIDAEIDGLIGASTNSGLDNKIKHFLTVGTVQGMANPAQKIIADTSSEEGKVWHAASERVSALKNMQLSSDQINKILELKGDNVAIKIAKGEFEMPEKSNEAWTAYDKKIKEQKVLQNEINHLKHKVEHDKEHSKNEPKTAHARAAIARMGVKGNESYFKTAERNESEYKHATKDLRDRQEAVDVAGTNLKASNTPENVAQLTEAKTNLQKLLTENAYAWDIYSSQQAKLVETRTNSAKGDLFEIFDTTHIGEEIGNAINLAEQGVKAGEEFVKKLKSQRLRKQFEDYGSRFAEAVKTKNEPLIRALGKQNPYLNALRNEAEATQATEELTMAKSGTQADVEGEFVEKGTIGSAMPTNSLVPVGKKFADGMNSLTNEALGQAQMKNLILLANESKGKGKVEDLRLRAGAFGVVNKVTQEAYIDDALGKMVDFINDVEARGDSASEEEKKDVKNLLEVWETRLKVIQRNEGGGATFAMSSSKNAALVENYALTGGNVSLLERHQEVDDYMKETGIKNYGKAAREALGARYDNFIKEMQENDTFLKEGASSFKNHALAAKHHQLGGHQKNDTDLGFHRLSTLAEADSIMGGEVQKRGSKMDVQYHSLGDVNTSTGILRKIVGEYYGRTIGQGKRNMEIKNTQDRTRDGLMGYKPGDIARKETAGMLKGYGKLGDSAEKIIKNFGSTDNFIEDVILPQLAHGAKAFALVAQMKFDNQTTTEAEGGKLKLMIEGTETNVEGSNLATFLDSVERELTRNNRVVSKAVRAKLDLARESIAGMKNEGAEQGGERGSRSAGTSGSGSTTAAAPASTTGSTATATPITVDPADDDEEDPAPEADVAG